MRRPAAVEAAPPGAGGGGGGAPPGVGGCQGDGSRGGMAAMLGGRALVSGDRRLVVVVAGPARVHPSRLVGHLRIHRWPRGVGDAVGEVALVALDERGDRLRGLRRCPPTDRRWQRGAPGTTGTVRSSGWIAGNSSQANGVETWAPGRARTHHAPNTVLCGAFWLKSMNTLAPRSSFHHLSVIRSGRAAARARATATAACRVPNESHPGSTRT